jgi:uncharacterized membrane protein
MAATRSGTTGLADIVGTRELLQLVVQKLASQLLLFSIATIVLLLVALVILGPVGIFAAVLIMIVFGVGAAGYLFVEERRRLEEGSEETTAEVLANRLERIDHGPAREGQPRVQLTAERRHPPSAVSASPRDIGVEQRTDTSSRAFFAIGEEIDLCVQSSEDCYLTLLNIGTSGRLTVLFPNALHPDSRLEGGKPHLIPGTEYGFRLILKGPPGIERLKAIATLDPIPLSESDFSSEGTLFKQLEPVAAARDIAVVEKHTRELSSDRWAEASLTFEVRQ